MEILQPDTWDEALALKAGHITLGVDGKRIKLVRV